MAKIAVTGAMGLIGGAVAAALDVRGHSVVSIGRDAGSAVNLDLADLDRMARMSLPPCDVLVHCAGVTDEEVKSDPAAALRRAALGTDRLIALAVAAGTRCMAYVSSAHVYGALSGHIDETLPPNPLSDYALAHFLAEQIFRRNAARHDLAVRILRPCAVFGPLAALDRFRRWSLIPFAFPRALVETGIIRITGTGRDHRNFVGTDVVAMDIANFVDSPASGVALINPVGSADLTVGEFAEFCARIGRDRLGRACRVEIAGVGGAGNAPLEYRSVAGRGRDIRTLESHVTELIRQCSQIGQHFHVEVNA